MSISFIISRHTFFRVFQLKIYFDTLQINTHSRTWYQRFRYSNIDDRYGFSSICYRNSFTPLRSRTATHVGSGAGGSLLEDVEDKEIRCGPLCQEGSGEARC